MHETVLQALTQHSFGQLVALLGSTPNHLPDHVDQPPPTGPTH
ncbi:MAG: hypothetical protein WCG47_18330 [Dermatophilaceae bacterium]